MALKATKISTAATDNFRLLKGKLITSADGNGDYIVCDLPKQAFIEAVYLEVATGFTVGSTGGVTVGIKEPGVAINASQIADNLVTLPEVVGMKKVTVGLALANGGVLTLGITKGNSAANFKGRVYVKYCVIH